MSDGGALSGRQGEFGHAVPVRPAVGSGSDRLPDRCLRGHQLSLGGAGNGWSHFYGLPDVTCRICRDLGYAARTWCLIDPTVQHRADEAPGQGLVLVAVPPAVRAGVGRIELRLEGRVVGAVDLRVCGGCRVAVLEYLRVEEDVRRLGFGRVLASAAWARAQVSRFRWSSTVAHESVEARAFWAAVGFPGRLGRPEYCSDMVRADEAVQ